MLMFVSFSATVDYGFLFNSGFSNATQSSVAISHRQQLLVVMVQPYRVLGFRLFPGYFFEMTPSPHLCPRTSTASQNKKLDRSPGGGAGIPGLALSTFSLVSFHCATIATPIPKLHVFSAILHGRGRVSHRIYIIIEFCKMVEPGFN